MLIYEALRVSAAGLDQSIYCLPCTTYTSHSGNMSLSYIGTAPGYICYRYKWHCGCYIMGVYLYYNTCASMFGVYVICPGYSQSYSLGLYAMLYLGYRVLQSAQLCHTWCKRVLFCEISIAVRLLHQMRWRCLHVPDILCMFVGLSVCHDCWMVVAVILRRACRVYDYV